MERAQKAWVIHGEEGLTYTIYESIAKGRKAEGLIVREISPRQLAMMMKWAKEEKPPSVADPKKGESRQAIKENLSAEKIQDPFKKSPGAAAPATATHTQAASQAGEGQPPQDFPTAVRVELARLGGLRLTSQARGVEAAIKGAAERWPALFKSYLEAQIEVEWRLAEVRAEFRNDFDAFKAYKSAEILQKIQIGGGKAIS